MNLSNNEPISKIPLGLTILSYTFFYLFYIIATEGLYANNVPTFILFPILIVCDFLWNLNHGCINFLGVFISFILGGAIGVAWAAIITTSGVAELKFFNGISNKETCSRPSKTLYSCKYVKKQS